MNDLCVALWRLARLHHLAKMERGRAEVRNPPPGPNDWVCPECGCDRIEDQAWVMTNTNQVVDSASDEMWCPQCEDHFKGAMTREDFKSRTKCCFCQQQTKPEQARWHQGRPVCENCWDERLRPTA